MMKIIIIKDVTFGFSENIISLIKEKIAEDTYLLNKYLNNKLEFERSAYCFEDFLKIAKLRASTLYKYKLYLRQAELEVVSVCSITKESLGKRLAWSVNRKFDKMALFFIDQYKSLKKSENISCYEEICMFNGICDSLWLRFARILKEIFLTPMPTDIIVKRKQQENIRYVVNFKEQAA